MNPMRQHLEREIAKQQNSIAVLERDLHTAKAVFDAYGEMLKKLPKENAPEPSNRELREGSDVSQAREAILKSGKPLHVGKILEALGKPNTKMGRAALAGSIGAYARVGKFFTKEGPNTFGVVGMQKAPMLVMDSLPMAVGE